jgi:hypothetical protein
MADTIAQAKSCPTRTSKRCPARCARSSTQGKESLARSQSRVEYTMPPTQTQTSLLTRRSIASSIPSLKANLRARHETAMRLEIFELEIRNKNAQALRESIDNEQQAKTLANIPVPFEPAVLEAAEAPDCFVQRDSGWQSTADTKLAADEFIFRRDQLGNYRRIGTSGPDGKIYVFAPEKTPSHYE